MAKKLTEQQKKAIYCVKHGHSKIVSMSFGYVHCGRCEAQIGDTLGGVFPQMPECALIGHNCQICQANIAKMTKHELAMIDVDKLFPKDQVIQVRESI
jgi:hypothetical protein